MNEDMPRASFLKCLWCHDKRARRVQTPRGKIDQRSNLIVAFVKDLTLGFSE